MQLHTPMCMPQPLDFRRAIVLVQRNDRSTIVVQRRNVTATVYSILVVRLFFQSHFTIHVRAHLLFLCHTYICEKLVGRWDGTANISLLQLSFPEAASHERAHEVV